MTAEVAVINKEAVALAADSAVTSQTEYGEKIYTSANKIFMLSKYQPVGIMIYGTATFMEIPFETLVKFHRSQLHTRSFRKLKEYAEHFLQGLAETRTLVPAETQEGHFEVLVSIYFMNIRERITARIDKQTSEKKRRVSKKEAQRIAEVVIRAHRTYLAKLAGPSSIPENEANELTSRYSDAIDRAMKVGFENLEVTDQTRGVLHEIAGLLGVKSFPFTRSFGTGVVIAGFGTDDFFPTLYELSVEGIIGDRLKYSWQRESTGEDCIMPFAQQEMVYRFMEGIDPDFSQRMDTDIEELLTNVIDLIVDGVQELDNESKLAYKKRLRPVVVQNLLQQYRQRVEAFRKKEYVDPIMGVVGMLPRDELAAMAESLVSLTSFKRHVSMQSETVAGPIDVAVISKGDGFIWVKRKQYFQPQLNPSFFANYYREMGNGQEATAD